MRGFGKLWHSGNVVVGADHIVQETRRKGGLTLQFRPIEYAIIHGEFSEVDAAQAAVFEWPKPLLATIMCNNAVRNQAVRLHFCQIVNVSDTRVFYRSNASLKGFSIGTTDLRGDKILSLVLLFGVQEAYAIQESIPIDLIDQKFVIGMSEICFVTALPSGIER